MSKNCCSLYRVTRSSTQMYFHISCCVEFIWEAFFSAQTQSSVERIARNRERDSEREKGAKGCIILVAMQHKLDNFNRCNYRQLANPD